MGTYKSEQTARLENALFGQIAELTADMEKTKNDLAEKVRRHQRERDEKLEQLRSKCIAAIARYKADTNVSLRLKAKASAVGKALFEDGDLDKGQCLVDELASAQRDERQ